MLPERTPDLIALDLLVSVAELGSLGQTGLRHHLSQPAVSMRMNGLGIDIVHREVPGVSLALEVTNSSRVLAAVTAGLADVGFIEGNDRDLPGLDSVIMRTDRLVVVVGPAHRGPEGDDRSTPRSSPVRSSSSGSEVRAPGRSSTTRSPRGAACAPGSSLAPLRHPRRRPP